jgi:hypothetical protein
MGDYNPQHKAVLDQMLVGVPGVKASKAFGYPAYKINGKVFAFVGGNGVALKLPIERVRHLILAHEAIKRFEPADGIIWKEWVSIDYTVSDDYLKDQPLFQESIEYVISQ